MTFPSRYALGLLLVCLVPAAFSAPEVGFSDDFGGPDLSPAWHETILASKALTYARPLAGALVVSDAVQEHPASVRNVYCVLQRSCTPLEGDFTAKMSLSWDLRGPAALMSVMLRILSPEGEILAVLGLHDWWGTASGNVRYGIGPGAKKAQLGMHVPYRAAGEFVIERVGEEYVLRLEHQDWSMVVSRGPGSRDPVGEVAISFEFYQRPPKGAVPVTHFGTVSLERVALRKGVSAVLSSASSAAPWTLGKPIVTYWAGPPLDDAMARQLADGGWNLAWCRNFWDLDRARDHGLRGVVTSSLLKPETLASAEKKAELDAFVDSMKHHPALYAYHIKDEPSAGAFAAYAPLVAYLRKRDPAHLAYFNLLPLGAKNSQLGTEGDSISAYETYVRRFIEVVHPALLSYDHYHFAADGDGDLYFANLAVLRRLSVEYHLPFMVIVQAASWMKNRRIPTGEELRWLGNTILAYGAQGISYYVYGYRGHDGGMVNLADGSPTSLYYAAKNMINGQFVAVATALRPLHSLGTYHVGMQPPGTERLPENADIRIEPPLDLEPYPSTHPDTSGWPVRYSRDPVRGFLIGLFGPRKRPTHALIVNLAYRTYSGRGWERRKQALNPIPRYVVGKAPLETFDPKTGRWLAGDGRRVKLALPPGGAMLVRYAQP